MKSGKAQSLGHLIRVEWDLNIVLNYNKKRFKPKVSRLLPKPKEVSQWGHELETQSTQVKQLSY